MYLYLVRGFDPHDLSVQFFPDPSISKIIASGVSLTASGVSSIIFPLSRRILRIWRNLRSRNGL